jgi:hypothetical protein
VAVHRGCHAWLVFQWHHLVTFIFIAKDGFLLPI